MSNRRYKNMHLVDEIMDNIRKGLPYIVHDEMKQTQVTIKDNN